MAQTRFSGPVKSDNGFEGNLTGTASTVSGVVNATALVIPTTTSALLGSAAAAVNTTNKTAGSAVYNTTTKTIYVAQIGGATGAWIDAADGTTTITPA